MKTREKNKVARGIVDLALYAVENSVGKCFPACVHEVKMPDSVRKEYLNKDMEEKQ